MRNSVLSDVVYEKKIEYETKRLPYLRVLPVMWALIFWVAIKKNIAALFGITLRTNFFLFDGLCPVVRRLKEKGGTWEALNILYNLEYRRSKDLKNRIQDFWTDNLNIGAVRNRYKLVVHQIDRLIRSLNKREVRVLELAAGSSEALLEAMINLRRDGIAVQSVLVDSDQNALHYAEMLARNYRLEDQIRTIRANILTMKNTIKKFQPDITEMVGFLDYFSDEVAVKLLAKIKRALPVGSVFLTANIMPNFESPFVHYVYEWPKMFYRKPEQLKRMLEQAGFRSVSVVIEPLKVHCVAIAR